MTVRPRSADQERRADPGEREPIRSIAIVRALALGDMLCAIPSIRAFRSLHPAARISLVGLPWTRELPVRYPEYLDESLEFPGFPGIPEVDQDPERTVAFLMQMQDRRFDLAVQLHGDGSWINAFVAMFGARATAGFSPPGWSSVTIGDTWIAYPAYGSEISRLLELPAALGAPIDERLEFPIREADREAVSRILPVPLEAGSYAVVHPGASTELRRWPADRFASIADRLKDRGLEVVLTGSAAEATVTARVRAMMQTTAVDLAGRTSLGALGAVVERAAVVVTNDTGVSHMSAAVGTPSVVIFNGSDHERWAPLDAELHLGVVGGSPESPASIAQVADAVDRQLGRTTPRTAYRPLVSRIP
jgi:ADP-heptose:LPS heptosyltransferase